MHLGCVKKARCYVGGSSPDVEFRRAGSILLPSLADRGSMGSTLSLAAIQKDNSDQIKRLQDEMEQESVSMRGSLLQFDES